MRNPVERVLREGVVVGLANHTLLIARDGKERPIDDSAAPIRIPTARIVGVVLVFRDVTERRRAEPAARGAGRARAAARERTRGAGRRRAGQPDQGRIRGHGLARAAHALNAIVGWAQHARATGGRTPRRVTRAARRPSSGTPGCRPSSSPTCSTSPASSRESSASELQSVDLEPVIEDAIEAVQPRADAKGIALDADLEPAPAPWAIRRGSSRSSGTCSPTRSSSRPRRRGAGDCCRRSTRTSRSVSRHRHGHRAGVPAARLRPLPPGRRLHTRRHGGLGTGAGHRQAARRDARRQRPGRERRRGPGRDLHRHAARGCADGTAGRRRHSGRGQREPGPIRRSHWTV